MQRSSTPISRILEVSVVLFISAMDQNASAIPVTFEVDMSGHPSYTPGSVIEARGSWNSWTQPLVLQPTGSNGIHTNTVEITGLEGSVFQYKFLCNGGWELLNMANRPFTLGNAAQTLPRVYFNNLPPVGTIGTNSVTFRVNMATQISQQRFTPNVDTVSVAGTFQTASPWSTTSFFLTNNGFGLYEGTFAADANYEGTFEYFKFVIRRGGIDEWESIANRTFFLTNGMILPVVFFNDIATYTPVTFQVDMSGHLSYFPFSQVEVRGSWDGWSQSLFLQAVGSTATHTNTVGVPSQPGATFHYKFLCDGIWELQGYPDRPFTLASSAQTLPLVYFNNLPPIGTTGTNSITFRVSMTTLISQGRFDTTNDTVSVAGTFQTDAPWNSFSFYLTNNGYGIYEGTYTADGNYEGTYEFYKFVIHRPGSEEWEFIENRTFFLTNGLELPVVFFNNQGDYIPVTFVVDMSQQLAYAGEILECKGSFNGWRGGFALTNDPGSSKPYLYSGTTYAYDPPGTVEYYKFTVNGGYSGLGWEAPMSTFGYDRTFVLQSPSTVLPAVFWNDLRTQDMLSQQTMVTFRVNMTNAAGTDGHAFDPVFDQVYLNGSWVPWWSWGYPNYELVLYRQGDSLIYSATLPLPAGTAVPLAYKYSINGWDNEAHFLVNHFRYVRTNGVYVLPVDTFGAQEIEESFGELKINTTGPATARLTWLGRPGVHVQTRTNLTLGSWEDLAGTAGLSAENVPMTGKSKFYRLIKPEGPPPGS